MKLPIIQSLWGCEPGESLSNLEKLCIQSFLDHGHEFHLYAYYDVRGVPDGCGLKDANEILPASAIYKYKNGSFAPFADWFRYAMLYQKGGFWADMDVVCVKPFAFKHEIVLNQHVTWAHYRYSNFAFGFSPGHPAMMELAEQCRRIGEARQYIEFYKLLTPAIEKHNLDKFTQPPLTFHTPIHPLYDYFPNGIDLPDATHSVHISNSRIARHKIYGKDDVFHQDCLFELLKKKHRIANLAGAKTITPKLIVSARNQAAKAKRKTRRKKRLMFVATAFAAGVLAGWLK